ncbi:MAG: type II toxin-antitoxin system RelE/ParE family toxin [Dongiaceae bacterium]
MRRRHTPRLHCRIGAMPSGWSMQCNLRDELWVVHAFQKKSTPGIKTPKHEIDLIKDRLKRLKERLR